MITRHTLLALAGTALLTASLSAQQLANLPVGTWANDVTPDGEVVVGTGPTGGFIWRWRVDPDPTYIAGGDMVAVSDDGQTVLGTIDDNGFQQAALWTELNGWQSIGSLGQCDFYKTSAYALSGDGKSAVGLGWLPGCDAVGFLWTEAGGMQALDSLGNGVNRASAISRDGQVVGGFAQGGFDRTPAVWSAADGTGSLYNINDRGEVHGFNNDGSLVLGEYNGRAFVDDGSGVSILGSLNGGNWSSVAIDISEDRETIVGYDYFSLSRQAWMWTQATGIVSMDQVLADAGFPGAPATFVCRAMSDDGNVIVGGNIAGGGGPFGYGAFIFERASEQVWENLDGALAGSNGTPHVVGAGTLAPLSTVSLLLTDGQVSGSSWLVMGLSELSLPFKGGVLVPDTDFVLGPFALDASGELLLSTHWPAGVPSGFVTYFQHWIPDVAGPQGFAASNGLGATAP